MALWFDLAAFDNFWDYDEEGELVTREVKGKFLNGEPSGIEALFVMKSEAEWERFMRFMNRYAEQNGLGFTKS